MYVSCQYKRDTELFHIITTRRRDQQQSEIRLHSQAKSPQVITYVSLLFEAVETSTPEIPARQELLFVIYQEKRNRNTRELFYTEHDQRFSSTRKGRKIHMGLSRHFCPIKLPSSGNLEYPLNFSVTFTEKI